MEDRVYNTDALEHKSKAKLNKLLESIKRNDGGLTKREQSKNIELLEFYINGGTSARDKNIVKDMIAGQADISDIGGMN